MEQLVSKPISSPDCYKLQSQLYFVLR